MMPFDSNFWQIDGDIKRIHTSHLDSEKKLQKILENNITIVDPDLLLIGGSISTPHGKEVDLLAINSEGDLTVLELKRGKSSREVVAQALEYAAWASSLNRTSIIKLFSSHQNNANLEDVFKARFPTNLPDEIKGNPKIIIVATELDSSTEKIIPFLTESHDIPINVLFFRFLKDPPHEYLNTFWLIDPKIIEARTDKLNKIEPWNGNDYYFEFGLDDQRSWEDAICYNFVSAGQGRRYSSRLDLLDEGNRIFVHTAGKGYIGVGIVKERAVPVNEFNIKINGNDVMILKAPMSSKEMGLNASDPEKSEYLVRVKWIKTLPIDEAVWVKGMFTNRNIVCKMRNKFTIDELTKRFNLEE